MHEITRGGEFLIKKTEASGVFIPEEQDEEQKMIRQTCIDFLEQENVPTPYEQLVSKTWSDEVRRLLDTLSPMEARILRWRFGLDEMVRSVSHRRFAAAARELEGQPEALLVLLRSLEQLHRSIQDGPFRASLPADRNALFQLLSEMERSGGWPYIPRLQLRTFLDLLGPEAAAAGLSAPAGPAAEAEGLPEVFRAAGADWREPGCSMCLAMNPDKLAPGERSASTSNRNFEGRQGRGGRTHLVSPAVAAATAVAGHFATPEDLK